MNIKFIPLLTNQKFYYFKKGKRFILINLNKKLIVISFLETFIFVTEC